MENLIIHKSPSLRTPVLVTAFGGWADAQDIATSAVRYLARKLPATKLAEIESEEFYDFTQARPFTYVNEQGLRHLRWPANEFFYWQDASSSRDMLLFVGREPNLKWKTYADIIAGVAEQHGVTVAVSLGAFLDVVPHTRAARITGSSNQPELRRALESMGILVTGTYQGPTGINSAVLDALMKKGILYGGLWGHAPHYLQSAPNPRVTHALLTRLSQILSFHIDLEELHAAGEAFDDEVGKIIGENAEISSYLKRLEEQYDDAMKRSEDLPNAQAMVSELEEYLRRQRGDGGPQAGAGLS